MTPQQIDYAVECYLRIRLLVQAANGGPGTSVQVTLTQTEIWSATQVWQQIWWLFFFSGMATRTAAPRAAAARAGGWFNNFATFVNGNAQASHPWHAAKTCGPQGGLAFKPCGAQVKLFCSKNAPYSAMPYRTGAKVVYRTNQLADFFTAIDTTAARSGRSFIHELAGGDAHNPNALEIALSKLIPITGPITAVHCLSDLGFQCSKPDIWMCRMASWCGWTPEHTSEDLMHNRRNGWGVLWAACLKIALAANDTLHECNPLRAFDWYVANFCMIHRPKSCPCNQIMGADRS